MGFCDKIIGNVHLHLNFQSFGPFYFISHPSVILSVQFVGSLMVLQSNCLSNNPSQGRWAASFSCGGTSDSHGLQPTTSYSSGIHVIGRGGYVSYASGSIHPWTLILTVILAFHEMSLMIKNAVHVSLRPIFY